MCMSIYALTYVNIGKCDACEGVPEDKDVQNDLAWFTYAHQFRNNLWGKKWRLSGVYTGSLFL